MRQSQLSRTMPPKTLHSEPTHTAGASSVHNYSVWTLSLSGPNPGKLVFIFVLKGTSVIWKTPTYSVFCVCVYTYPSFYSSLLSSPTVWSTVGRRWCAGGRKNYLQSLGLSHLWKITSCISSFLEDDSYTCCQECSTLCFPLAVFLTLLTP